MKSGTVYYRDIPAGTLTRDAQGYAFRYDPSYCLLLKLLKGRGGVIAQRKPAGGGEFSSQEVAHPSVRRSPGRGRAP